MGIVDFQVGLNGDLRGQMMARMQAALEQRNFMENQRRARFSDGMQEKTFQSNEELKRAQLDATTAAQQAAERDRQVGLASGLADQIPAGQFIAPDDPAVGMLRTGGRGGLLQEQQERPEVAEGPLMPGDTGAAKARGFIKTSSARQQMDEALRADRLADNERAMAAAQASSEHQGKVDAETARHNRAMESKPSGNQSPQPQFMIGPDGKTHAVQFVNGKAVEIDLPGDFSKTVRPVTGAERSTLGYFNRMLEAERNARKVEDTIPDSDIAASNYAPGWLENFLKTPEGQQYSQAQRMFTEARLRKESGAAIPETEVANDRRTNFRMPGDKKETIAQKRASRLLTMRGIGNAAGRALHEYYGEGTNLDALLKEFGDAAPAAAGGGMVSMTAPDGRKLSVPADKVAEMESHGAKRVP